jgi:hypothetical protein
LNIGLWKFVPAIIGIGFHIIVVNSTLREDTMPLTNDAKQMLRKVGGCDYAYAYGLLKGAIESRNESWGYAEDCDFRDYITNLLSEIEIELNLAVIERGKASQ